MADGRRNSASAGSARPGCEAVSPDALDAVRLAGLLARGARFPETTSLGRLFDAAAALSGVRLRQAGEGQAAMELEALVEAPRTVSTAGGSPTAASTSRR